MPETGTTVARHAVRAAVEVAAAHGVHGTEPVVLADGFNVVVWLRPAPVVARVVLLPALLRSDPHAMITRELSVTGFLDGKGVPVARPSAELPPGPHRHEGLWMSFWEHLDVEPGRRPAAAESGALLRDLHESLREYPATSPALEVPVADIRAFVREAGRFPVASTEDVEVIGRTLGEVLPVVTQQRPMQQVHGDAHPGNLLRTPRGWTWVDFEESVRGPVEFDLACLLRTGALDGAEALREYGPVDAQALRPFRTLRRLHAAVWFTVLAGRVPEYRDRARRELDRVRACHPA